MKDVGVPAPSPPEPSASPGSFRRAIGFLRRFHETWKRDQGSRMAAALAYYAFLALAPLLILAVLIAGILFGEESARLQIVERAKEAIGPLGGEVVQGILRSAARPREGIVALGVGLLAILVGASRAFQELQKGLGGILGGSEEPGAGHRGIFRRLVSIGLVLAVGFGLVTLMLGGMALDAARRYLEPGLLSGRSLDYLLTFGLGTLLLSLLYRFVPGSRAGWKEAGSGAAVAAALFVLARGLVSLYLGRAMSASSFGAAGLVVVILIWVHFSALLVYVGAELTRLRADARRPAAPGVGKALGPDL